MLLEFLLLQDSRALRNIFDLFISFYQQDDEHIVLEPGDLFPPLSPPPSPSEDVKKGPQDPQLYRLFRVTKTPVTDNVR